MVQDLRLVEEIMNVMAGQPDGTTRKEMRRYLNQEGSTPWPGVHLLLFILLLLLSGVHLLHLLLLPRVHLVLVVHLVVRVFLLLGGLPLPLLLGVHLLGVVPLPVAGERLPITYPLPMTVVTAPVTTVTSLVHLYSIACMVALGALAGLVAVVLRPVLGELLDKEIRLRVWVLVWEMVVAVRKVVREVPRETMIQGMWVLGGVVAEVVGC